MNRTTAKSIGQDNEIPGYHGFLNGIVEVIENGRQQAFEVVRKIITPLYPDAQISPELGFKDPTITKFFGLSDPFPARRSKNNC